MARDVAQRDLDLRGFRIANLGDPTAPGDATRTDNLSVPNAARRDGAPGSSALAAPADHVHPLAGDLITLTDPVRQLVDLRTEIWFAVIDFDSMVGANIQFGLAGLLQTCLLRLWLDGVVGNPTAGTLVMNIDSDSGGPAPVAGLSSEIVAKPAGARLLTLTAERLPPAPDGLTFGRVITIRGLL